MSDYLIVFFSLFYISAFSQNSSDVFLIEIENNKNGFQLNRAINISKNPGYDNQPYFLDDQTFIFSSERNGQTDIRQHHHKYGTTSWLNFSESSEYSPIKVPNQDMVTAIKLDADGTQQLWKYSLRNGESEVLVANPKIGYQLWYDASTLISSVLANDRLELFKIDLTTGKNEELDQNVGRSLQNIPNSKLISYVSKKNDKWHIKSMNPQSGSTKTIIPALDNSEDFCWMADGTLLMGQDNKLFQYNAKKDKDWTLVKTFDSISNITRLAVSPNNKLLALVAESSVATVSEKGDQTAVSTTSTSSQNNVALVQSHIEPYNSQDMEGFLKPFAENVKVYHFPSRLISSNKTEMREGYEKHFQRNKYLHVTVNNRMTTGNFVIDEEISTVNNSTERHVTIYKTNDSAIESMNFISEIKTVESPEVIVNQQLEAYNSKDIEAFLKTYSNDITLINYPNTTSSQGKDSMREQYGAMFKSIPDLNAQIVKRMVIGNKVIDKEQVTFNGRTIYAIAIYEVEKGLIKKVTFIQ